MKIDGGRRHSNFPVAMVLLECLRGSVDSIPAQEIDRIILSDTNTGIEADDAAVGGESKQTESQIREGQSQANQKERFKNAHKYCRAVVPRRIKDFHKDPNNPNISIFTTDLDGDQTWRLRQIGDPVKIQTHDGEEYTGTKPYPVCCPCKEAHLQLADFGIGVGLYYTTLATWMGFLLLLFVINVPPMYCNVQFKQNLADYKACRGLSADNTTGLVPAEDCANFWGADAPPALCGFVYPDTVNGTTTWDQWIAEQDYANSVKQFSRFDYGGSLAPVTVLQGVVECVTIFIMIVLMVALRRFEDKVANAFDAKLQSCQDYSVRVSGVLPRDPQAYYDYYNDMLKRKGLMGQPGQPNVGVLRVTVLYDIDNVVTAMRWRLRAHRNREAADIAYTVRDTAKTLDLDAQKEDYLKGGTDGKPTTCNWLKGKIGCGRWGTYLARESAKAADAALEKAIQELRNAERDGTLICDPHTGDAQDDPTMRDHRRPIFAFVVFQTEQQQTFICNQHDHGLLIRRKRYNNAVESLRNYVETTGKTSPMLAHPLPANATEADRVNRKQLGMSLLDNVSLAEANEPSDVNWSTQGYLTGRNPVGDADLDQTGRPGGSRKNCTKCLRNVGSLVVAAVILIILFVILLYVSISTASLSRGSLGSAYLDTAIGYILAGLISFINMLLPVIMKQTVFAVEITASETEKQTSLVIKLTAVRICNAVLITFLVTEYDQMLSLSLASKISSLLVLDIVFGPTLRILDIYNLIMRYVVAKKARTQAKMNTAFNGTYWLLAERYTDVTKTFFLCCFYSAIVPSGYMLAFLAVSVNYFVDKYLLLRRWRIPPMFDATISNANRYFQYLAVLAHACVALYFYRNWPFECNVFTEDPAEQELCLDSREKPLFPSGYTRRSISNTNWPFYLATLILMIITVCVIAYYFFFKVVARCCNKLFNCVTDKQEVDVTDQVTAGDIRFTQLEHPGALCSHLSPYFRVFFVLVCLF